MSQEKTDARLKLLRHPMMIVLVSFLLSGLLAAIFSNWLAHRTTQAEQQRAMTLNRKIAVQNLSIHIYERRARAEMLASSFRRKAPLDEVKQRKQHYDEAYVKWNSNHLADVFLIRDVLQVDDYTYFESVLEFTLVDKILQPLDACLTSAYDAAIAGAEPIPILDKCQSRRLLQQALDCGYALADELYKLSSAISSRTEATREIAQRCPN